MKSFFFSLSSEILIESAKEMKRREIKYFFLPRAAARHARQKIERKTSLFIIINHILNLIFHSLSHSQLNNVAEIRLDAYKMVSQSRRPLAERVEDIGACKLDFSSLCDFHESSLNFNFTFFAS